MITHACIWNKRLVYFMWICEDQHSIPMRMTRYVFLDSTIRMFNLIPCEVVELSLWLDFQGVAPSGWHSFPFVYNGICGACCRVHEQFLKYKRCFFYRVYVWSRDEQMSCPVHFVPWQSTRRKMAHPWNCSLLFDDSKNLPSERG